MVEEAQWVYAEVEKKLRLCIRDSPYLGSKNVATCNELNTYLHLVDGFVSSPQRDFFDGDSHHHHHRLVVLN
ncbi:hypothetical protein AHAS_Ahas04G0154800 [Arachis hypogaea]